MRLRGAPQITLQVIVVSHCYLPAVFIDIKHPSPVDMFHSRLKRTFHDPHPMQLVTCQRRVDMLFPDDVIVIQVLCMDAIGVIGDIEFLLAFQLPVILLGRAVKHIELIHSAQVIRVGCRIGIGNIRRPQNTTQVPAVGP